MYSKKNDIKLHYVEFLLIKHAVLYCYLHKVLFLHS